MGNIHRSHSMPALSGPLRAPGIAQPLIVTAPMSIFTVTQIPPIRGVTYAYFVPIFRVVDPNVSADGQGGQSVSGPYNGYGESYTWNINDYTVKTMKDRRGYTTSWTYPTTGVLANTGLPGSKTDGGGYLTQYYYDGYYRPIEQIDNVNTSIGGDRSTFTYDATTHALKKSEVNPATDIYGITPSGYGSYAPVNPVDTTTTFAYNTNGTLASKTIGSDNSTVYSNYDVYGNARTITMPSGNVWAYTFDTLDNKLSETPPASGPMGATHYAYDEWNRLVTTSYADSTTSVTVYDANSNKTSDVNENGHSVNLFYDQMNRVYSTDQPVDTTSSHNIDTKATYDRAGNKNTLTNSNGGVTTDSFDERCKLVLDAYPGGHTRQYHFDGNGNVDKKIDGRGYETDFAYDAMNRLTTTHYIHDARTVTKNYRVDGVRTSMTDTNFSGSTWTWTYNGAKLLTQSFQPVPFATVNNTYYTGSGRRKTMAPGSQTFTYIDDAAGRLYQIQQALGDTTAVTYTYNADDFEQGKQYGLSTWSETTNYDLRGRISQVNHNNATQGDSTTYTRDGVGNVKTASRGPNCRWWSAFNDL